VLATVGGMGIVAALLLAAGLRRRGHRRHLAAMAGAAGLNYHPADTLDLRRRYSRLTLLREGHDRSIWDVITGSTCYGTLSCFAFRYEIGFGAQRVVQRWLVTVMETDRERGRVALRRCSCGFEQGSAWDVSGRPFAGPPGSQAGWTTMARCREGLAAPGDDFLRWLDEQGRDLCIELCDHLIALQVPLGNHAAQVEWLLRVGPAVVRRLTEPAPAGGDSRADS